jgi:uncharacterized protein (DUF736 family)
MAPFGDIDRDIPNRTCLSKVQVGAGSIRVPACQTDASHCRILSISSWGSICGLDGACLTGNRLRLDRPPATAGLGFLTPAGKPPSSPSKKSDPSRLPLRSSPSGAVRSFPDLVDSHRGRNRAARNSERNATMATIGTFTSTANGFTGQIRTLALNVKARIARVENPSEKGPQFRVYAGTVELGAAWQKTSEQGRDYLSVKLDDPSFPAPIYATLAEVEGEEGLQLIWSRPNRD